MDKDRFIQILKENKWVLYKVISLYCKDLEDRKDLEQEILIQLWKSIESYNGHYKISTWIYKVAMNVAISFYRSNKTRKSNTDSITESIFQVQTEISEPLDEERKFLNYFINQLDEFNREILILYMDDHSYKEIADIVGITESNVGTKINRIKKKLQENYEKLNNVGHGIK